MSEREQYERNKGEVQGALDDRDTALKQVKEHKQMVQVERDKITRLKDQYSREIAIAVDTATKARDNVFALQNKRLHAAEKAKEDLEQKHAEDIAALEAKHADSSMRLAYDAATIRTFAIYYIIYTRNTLPVATLKGL